MAKAMVLPVPVWAIPTTSFPSMAGGMALACIGVGVLNFKDSSADKSLGAIPNP
jgi:hypothetical protein